MRFNFFTINNKSFIDILLFVIIDGKRRDVIEKMVVIAIVFCLSEFPVDVTCEIWRENVTMFKFKFDRSVRFKVG